MNHRAHAQWSRRFHRLAPNALRPRHRCNGFTYLALLFLIVIVGAGLVAVAQVWHTQVQRQKEQQLLFVGNQFRQAIASYYERAPGGARQFPTTLVDLLQDPRFPNVQRHLRQVYLDPMTGKNEWGVVRAPDGGILGVHSLSEETPLKVAGFSGKDAGFAEVASYRGWTFAYLPFDSRGVWAPRSGQGNPVNMPGIDPAAQRSNVIGSTKQVDLGQLEKTAREARCRSQRVADLEICDESDEDADGGSASGCPVSASRRQQACLRGEPIPPLISQ